MSDNDSKGQDPRLTPSPQQQSVQQQVQAHKAAIQRMRDDSISRIGQKLEDSK